MSDAVQIASAFFQMVTAIVGAVLAYMMFRVKESQQAAVAEVHQVKETLQSTEARKLTRLNEVKVALVETAAATAAKIDETLGVVKVTLKTGEATHLLVNSAMAEALRIGMDALKRIATMSGATADDARAAEQASRMYENHMERQKAIDAAALNAKDGE